MGVHVPGRRVRLRRAGARHVADPQPRAPVSPGPGPDPRPGADPRHGLQPGRLSPARPGGRAPADPGRDGTADRIGGRRDPLAQERNPERAQRRVEPAGVPHLPLRRSCRFRHDARRGRAGARRSRRRLRGRQRNRHGQHPVRSPVFALGRLERLRGRSGVGRRPVHRSGDEPHQARSAGRGRHAVRDHRRGGVGLRSELLLRSGARWTRGRRRRARRPQGDVRPRPQRPRVGHTGPVPEQSDRRALRRHDEAEHRFVEAGDRCATRRGGVARRRRAARWTPRRPRRRRHRDPKRPRPRQLSRPRPLRHRKPPRRRHHPPPRHRRLPGPVRPRSPTGRHHHRRNQRGTSRDPARTNRRSIWRRC